jgi:hypothetical protein
MNNNLEFVYPGYLNDESINFFGDKRISEKRDGCGAVGTFIKIPNGKTHMPSKGDIFIKDNLGNITLKSK